MEALSVRDPGIDTTGLLSLRGATSIYWSNGGPHLAFPALTSVGDLAVHGGVQELVLPDGIHAEELGLSQAEMVSFTAPVGAELEVVEVQRCEALETVDLSAAAHIGAVHLIDVPELTEVRMPPTEALSQLTVDRTVLPTLDAFAGLRRIDGALWLTGNPSLVDVMALHDLEYVDEVTITDNEALGSLTAMDLVNAIDEIGTSWVVWGNR